MKMVSPFVIDLGSWFFMVLLKLLYLLLSFAWWISLATTVYKLAGASDLIKELYHRYNENTPMLARFREYPNRLLIVRTLSRCLPFVILTAFTYYSLSLHWITRETMYCVQFEVCVLVTVFVTPVLLYTVVKLEKAKR